MATSPETIAFIFAHVTLPDTSPRKMFGEYGIFVRGVMVALVCDNRLFIKPTEAGLALLGKHELGVPYPGAKPLPLVPPKFVKAKGKLDALFDATRQALPMPKRKMPTAVKRKAVAKESL